ncbi:MAG TPA: hypothetical protein VFP94_03640 [Terriglobales bacterium]|nr:hypothetical protein [Terriglobales bacterium]
MAGVQPATALTDLLLVMAALIFGLRLRPRLWKIGFCTATAASACGVAFHSGAQSLALWDAILLLIGAATAFFVAAALSQPYSTWLGAGLGITLAALAAQQSPLPFHNAIFHVMEIATLYCLYRGARVG